MPPAKKWKIPGTPIWLVPTAPTAKFIVRMAGGHIRDTLPGRLVDTIWKTCSSVTRQAQRMMGARYRWTGRSAASWSVTGGGKSGGVWPYGPYVTMGPSPDRYTSDIAFGKWAWRTSPFSVPSALHEGIKRHWVWLKTSSFRRPELIRWARAHGFMEPPGNWGMMVYPGTRSDSAEPALDNAVQAFHTSEVFQDRIAQELDEVLAV